MQAPFSSPNTSRPAGRIGLMGRCASHPGAGVYRVLARVPRARFWLLLGALCISLAQSARAANVHFRFVNPIGGAPLTNSFRIQACTSNVLANGSPAQHTDLPRRFTPDANGDCTITNLGINWYDALDHKFIFCVYDSSSTLYDVTNLIQSGYNIFRVTVYGTNPPPTFNEITNAVGQYFTTSNATFITSNLLYQKIIASTNDYNVTLNAASNSLRSQIVAATNSGITALTATNISAYQAKISTNDLNTTVLARLTATNAALTTRITAATNDLNTLVVTKAATNHPNIYNATNILTDGALLARSDTGAELLKFEDQGWPDNSEALFTVAGIISQSGFIGNGYQLTNLPITSLTNVGTMAYSNAPAFTLLVTNTALKAAQDATNDLSGVLGARIIATNNLLVTRTTNATNDLNTVLRALIVLKQFGSATLTNLSATGAETNQIAAGSGVTITTNGGVKTISSSGGSGTGIQTNGGTGINNTFTNATLQFSSANWGSNNVNTPNNRGNSILSGEANTLGGSSPGQGNLIVGGLSNVLSSGANSGSVIGGGTFNSITINSWADVIAGGWNNVNSGLFSVIPGGLSNYVAASSDSSFAAGKSAYANHSHSFVWSDGSSASAFGSSANNQFLIQSTNGVGINTNNPSGNALRVIGTTATDNLNIGTRPVLQYTTNNIVLTNAGTALVNIGTYTNVNSTLYTNPVTGCVITNNVPGNWQSKNGTTVYYSGATPTALSTVQSGSSPAPSGYFGSYFFEDGVQHLGVINSTNLDARIAAAGSGTIAAGSGITVTTNAPGFWTIANSGGGAAQTNISYTSVTNFSAGLAANAAQIGAIPSTNAVTATNAPDGSNLSWNKRLNKGNRNPVYYIGDYDFDSDVGDEHGVKIACAMFDQQLMIPLAFGNTLTNEYAAAALQSFLTYYGYGDVPVGVTRTQRYSLTAFSHAPNMTNIALRATYPAYSLYNSNFPSAVDVYRKALAGAPNGSVVLNTEGDLNNLQQLWNSAADTFSPLTGQQLMEAKIKYILIDAGTTNNVSGYNLAVDPYAASVITNLTVPVVFCLVSMPTNYVGQNTANPLYHPEDSPVYQGATNYMGIYGLSNPQRFAWDGYSKTYIAAAANVTDGTNWFDGTALTKISGPYRMVYSGANDYLYISNSLPGVTANQYYLTEGGLNTICTNFINAFIDAPAAVGQGDYRNFARLAASTNTYTGKANFNNRSTNSVAVGTNALIVDTVNGRVQVGADRETSFSGGTTNRLEINGSPATDTVGTWEWMFTAQKPVNSGTVWPQAMRFGLSRSKAVTSFSADTLLRWQIYDNAATTLNDDATWTSYLDVTRTNFNVTIPFTASNATLLGTTTANGSGITNIQLSSITSPTNLYGNAVTADFAGGSREASTNLAGNLTFTGVANFNTTNYNSLLLHCTASADRTITPAAGWGKTRATFVVTNGTRADLIITMQLGVFTNLSQIDYY